MMLELSRHQSTRSGANDDEQEDSPLGDAQDGLAGSDSDEPVDSRWAALKQLKNKL